MPDAVSLVQGTALHAGHPLPPTRRRLGISATYCYPHLKRHLVAQGGKLDPRRPSLLDAAARPRQILPGSGRRYERPAGKISRTIWPTCMRSGPRTRHARAPGPPPNRARHGEGPGPVPVPIHAGGVRSWRTRNARADADATQASPRPAGFPGQNTRRDSGRATRARTPPHGQATGARTGPARSPARRRGTVGAHLPRRRRSPRVQDRAARVSMRQAVGGRSDGPCGILGRARVVWRVLLSAGQPLVLPSKLPPNQTTGLASGGIC